MANIKGYQVFFTVMEGDKFVPSNICCDMTSRITGAVRFDYLDDAKDFCKSLNSERDFKIIRVKYELNEIEK